MTSSKWVILILSSFVLATGIIFLLASLYTEGRIDINSLKSHYGWKYGEMWFETIGFLLVALWGFYNLGKM